MCGIAGIYRSPTPESDAHTALAMAEAIACRGPDAQGVLVRENTVFAHRRLAIIDLNRAADQPMIDAHDRCMIVFNGEIYNFREIAARLEAAGTAFRTRGDTEVILELYLQEGAAGLEALDGMFAFAIYDRRSGELLLMRDRFGKKPLFYFQPGDGSVVFASELAALKRHPAWRGELRHEAIHDFLAYKYIPGSETVYRNVFRLPPATRAGFRADGQVEFTRYWRLDYRNQSAIGFEDAAGELRAKLERAAAKRLVADVPCGIFLSGGVDSGIVAMLAAQASATPLAAFTIGFEVEKYDERIHARTSARWINEHTAHGLIHTEKVVNFRSFEVLKKLTARFGEPFADFSQLPEYFLSAFAAREVKFVLSGDGADELFGGYERYLAMKYCACFEALLPAPLRRLCATAAARWLPDPGKRNRLSRLTRLLKLAAAPASRRYFELMTMATEAERRVLYGPRMQTAELPDSAAYLRDIEAAATTANRLERYAETDVASYLEGDILTKVDRACMANSLEVRSPFLDTEVAEFAATLPFDFKQRGTARKRILHAACADCVPPAVWTARKRGFGVPLDHWFRSEWQTLLAEHLLEGRLVRDNWMRRAPLERLIAEHQCCRIDHSELLGALLILAIFLEQERA